MHSENEIRIQGTSVSPGIAIGLPFFISYEPSRKVAEVSLEPGEVEIEIARYKRALILSREELYNLQKELHNEGAEEAVKIIDTHIQMLQDPLITTQIEERVFETRKNIEAVLNGSIERYKKKLAASKDPLFRQRLMDIVDVVGRICSHLKGSTENSGPIPSEAIVFIQELAPSKVAAMRPPYVGAFVARSGGGNSHAALIARAKGIPYISSIDSSSFNLQCTQEVIVDGFLGQLIINPSVETLKKYRSLRNDHVQIHAEKIKESVSLPAKTLDGVLVSVHANIGSFSELDTALACGAQGVGLFRSEYSLMESKSDFFSEEEQYEIYRRLVDALQQTPCVIRAFDIGGDKCPDAFKGRKQRGLRLLLQEPAFFRSQVRAIARLFLTEQVYFLLPWVVDLEELMAAKRIIAEVCAEFNLPRALPVGCMVELPSLVLMIQEVAEACDFLSIGTNDLMQYTLGIERDDPAWTEPRYLMHPSLIRMIYFVQTAASKAHKPLSICGEIASHPRFVPLLLGLGIETFSCAPMSIPLIKQAVRSASSSDCKILAEKALQVADAESLIELIDSFWVHHAKTLPREEN